MPRSNAGAALTPEDKAAIEADVASAKSQLANLKADLDVVQRKYALDQQTYYGKTNYAADKAGAAALAGEKSDVDAKQADVAAAEKKLAAVQAKFDEANKASAAAAAQEKSARNKQDNSAGRAAGSRADQVHARALGTRTTPRFTRSKSPPRNCAAATGSARLGSVPLLIVYISLDTLDAPAHNPACFTGRFPFFMLGGVLRPFPLPAHLDCEAKGCNICPAGRCSV